VRTRDGKHYAKVRLIRGVKQTNQGEDHSAYWLQYAYQADGTRNLEITINREYGFTFEKFGLKRCLFKTAVALTHSAERSSDLLSSPGAQVDNWPRQSLPTKSYWPKKS
jgi:hypothetical protein